MHKREILRWSGVIYSLFEAAYTQCVSLFASKSLQSIKEKSIALITYPQNVSKLMENELGHKVLKSKLELLGVFIMTRNFSYALI